MPVFNNILAGAAGGGGAADFKIKRSLRFNSNDTAYLSRTPSSPGNRKTWTWSGWVKRSKLGTEDGIFVCSDSNANSEYATLYFNSSNELKTTAFAGSSIEWRLTTNRVFRDPSAWMHIVLAVDTTASTAGDRVKLYVNGVRETSFRQETYPSPNFEGRVNKTEAHAIGSATPYNTWYGDFSIAEVHFLDGLTPTTSTDTSGSVTGTPNAEYLTVFGEFSADTGVWNPIEYTGDHGPTPVSYSDNGQTDLNDGNVYLNTQPVDNIFDGDDTTYSRINRGTNSNPRATFLWQPTNGISGVTKIRIKYDYCSRYQINNGTWYNVNNNGGYQEIYNGSAFTLTTLKIQRTDASASDFGIFVYGVEINDALISNINNNGFHLDFSDNSNNDTLGDTGDYAKTTGSLTTTTGTGTFYSNTNPSRAFDGNTSNEVYGGWASSGDDSNLIWSPPSGAYSVNSGSGNLRVYAGYYSTIYVNGVSKATGAQSSGSDWVTLDHTGAINSIKVENTVNDNVARISAIEINKKILTTNAWTVNNLAAGTPYNAGNSITSSGTLAGAGYILNGATDYDATMSNSGTGAWIEFNPPGGIAHNDKVEVMANNNPNDNMRLQLNGGSLVNTVASNTYVTLASGSSGTINKIRLQGDTSLFRWRSIRVDGVVLKEVSSGDDSLIDSPTDYQTSSGNNGGNYATLNSIDSKSATISNGNLEAQIDSSGDNFVRGTIGVSSSKYYWEFTTLSSNNMMLGAADVTANGNYNNGNVFAYYANGGALYGESTGKAGSWSGSTLAVGDILGVALDMDNGTLKFYKNNSLIGTAWTGLTGRTIAPYIGTGGGSGNKTAFNAGQRPFAYTPPTGYKSLCTQNLDDPLITDPSTAFDAKLWTGNNSSSRAITGYNFSPDFVWIKIRNDSYGHAIFDNVRGPNKRLDSVGLNQEQTITDGLHSFNTNGFTIGNRNTVGESNKTYVGWAWDAGNDANPTSISAGGLNSSVYDQSTTWSSLMSGHYQNAASAFDGNGTTYAEANSGATIEIDLSNNSITATSRLQVLNDPGFTGSTDVQYKIYTTSSSTPAFSKTIGGTESFDEASSNWSSAAITKITVRGLNEGARISKVIYDGKTLVNNTTTPPNVPTIASNVRANQTAGFSIATYTGNGSANQTVAHNLNAAPAFVIIKDLTSSQNWAVMHTGAPVVGTLDGGTEYEMLEFSSTSASSNFSFDTIWDPTSTTVKIAEGANSAHWVNKSGDNYVMYSWAPVKNYSSFGSYTGNSGQNFQHLGFQPKWIMIKNTSTNSYTAYTGWAIFDTERPPGDNVNVNSLFANNTNQEGKRGNNSTASAPDFGIDILSNGFCLRDNGASEINLNGETYVYAAFAENPFKYARAR